VPKFELGDIMETNTPSNQKKPKVAIKKIASNEEKEREKKIPVMFLTMLRFLKISNGKQRLKRRELKKTSKRKRTS